MPGKLDQFFLKNRLNILFFKEQVQQGEDGKGYTSEQ